MQCHGLRAKRWVPVINLPLQQSPRSPQPQTTATSQSQHISQSWCTQTASNKHPEVLEFKIIGSLCKYHSIRQLQQTKNKKKGRGGPINSFIKRNHLFDPCPLLKQQTCVGYTQPKSKNWWSSLSHVLTNLNSKGCRFLTRAQKKSKHFLLVDSSRFTHNPKYNKTG